MPYFASIHPNRIVKRYSSNGGSWEERYFDKKEKSLSNNSENLKIKKSSFGLSYQTKSKIRDSIQLLFELSKPRTVWVSSNKPIYNFRASFVTLTLPSKQIHSDLEIKKCLNNFLTRLRQTYKIDNYIWKAELQKNENIHFHLVLDIYIPFQAIRYYWNLAINVLGYVDRYSDKMQKLSLSEYAEVRGKRVADVLIAYQKGCHCKWSNPPSEQAVAVRSKKQLAVYLSKYLTKSTKKAVSAIKGAAEKTKINISELVRVRKFGRVWARSQSISKIKIVTRWSWDDILSLVSQFKGYESFFTKKIYDFCEIWYFNFNKIPHRFKLIIRRIIRDIGISYDYPFPELSR